MRIVIVLALALAMGCKKGDVEAVKQAAADARAGDTAATQAVQGYQRSVDRAEQVRDQANAALQQKAQGVEDAGQ